MRADAAASLRHTLEIFCRDAATGREAFVRANYHADGDREWVVLDYPDGRRDEHELTPGSLAKWRRRFFGGGGPDGGEAARAIPDPKNLDGSPRAHPLIDRLAKRALEVEALAAD